jgi:hypothetical protein
VEVCGVRSGGVCCGGVVCGVVCVVVVRGVAVCGVVMCAALHNSMHDIQGMASLECDALRLDAV